MKTSADIALVANVITDTLGTPGDQAWATAGDVIEALDQAGRMKPTPIVERRCTECGCRYEGPGHMCPRCRRSEDGHERHDPDSDQADVA